MVLLLNKDWMDHLEERGKGGQPSVGPLTGEEKELLFLQAYAQVQDGRACWLDRWMAVTWGAGTEGTDERFVQGQMQPHMVSKRG